MTTQPTLRKDDWICAWKHALYLGLFLSVTYVCTYLRHDPLFANPIWLPAGVAVIYIFNHGILAAALLFGVLLGVSQYNAVTDINWLLAIPLTLSKIIAAYTPRYFIKERALVLRPLDSLGNYIPFLIFGCALPALISANCGALLFYGLGDANYTFENWIIWVLGDFLGIHTVLVTNTLLRYRPHLTRPKVSFEYIVFFAFLLLLGLHNPALHIASYLSYSDVMYLAFPLLFWSAIRFSLLSTIITALLLTGYASSAVLHDPLLFSENAFMKLAAFQLYLLSMYIPVLVVSLLIIERTQDRNKLAEANTLLQEKIYQESQRAEEKESLYQRIITITSEPYVQVGVAPDYPIEDVNPALCELLQKSRSELLHTDFTSLAFDQAERIKILHNLKNRIANRNRHYETILRGADNTAIYVAVNATNLPVRQGNALKSFAFMTNITEHKRQAHIQRAHRKRIESYLNALPFPIAMVQPASGEFIYVNKALKKDLRIGDISIHDLQTRFTFADFFLKQDDYVWMLEEVMMNGRVHMEEIQIKRTTGASFWALASMVFTENHDGEDVILASFTDISEKERLKRDLENTITEIDTIFQQAGEGIALIRNGKFQRINQRMNEIFGYSPRELENANISIVFEAQDAYENFLQQAQLDLNSCQAFSTEFPLKHRDGHLFWCKLSCRDLEQLNDSAASIWVIQDVDKRKRNEAEARKAREDAENALTELRAAQESLVQAEKLASLGQLVAGVSHEINTPIGVAVTSASHLKSQTEYLKDAFFNGKLKKSKLETYIEDTVQATDLIHRNIKRASALIQSFKHISVDQSSEQMRDFNLRDYTNEILTSLGPNIKKSRVTVENHVPDEIQAFTFPSAIYQIISNLMMNALLHAYEPNEPGRITISAQMKDAATIELIFADDGKGVPKAIENKIFDPFFTTRRGKGGAGLGLNIVYNLAQRTLQGNIFYRRTPMGGATFVLRFPMRLNPMDMIDQQVKNLENE
jgi:PAS domain S-box-containing protein